MRDLSVEEVEAFRRDGFLLLDDWLAPGDADAAARRFEPLFHGAFETGLQPDEWNWREGRDDPSLTRQICNGWKADLTIARLVLAAAVGRACARLMGWPGARLNQDNVIWKPPGARALGFHQDNSYQGWVDPPAMVSCWIALDETSAEGGTLSYVRGSHRWGVSPPIEQFHGPEDFTKELRRAAAQAGAGEPELVPVVLPRGGVAFHHGSTWHGSAPNRSQRPRRALVAHCMHRDARFSEDEVGPIYGRYRRFGSREMDESFFPLLWSEDGRRSDFIEPYLAGKRA